MNEMKNAVKKFLDRIYRGNSAWPEFTIEEVNRLWESSPEREELQHPGKIELVEHPGLRSCANCGQPTVGVPPACELCVCCYAMKNLEKHT